MTCNLLLLGEDNPYGSEPEFALYCYPVGCSGYRLRRILGLPQHQYLGLPRANLCVSGSWSMKDARRRARDLLSPHVGWDVIVMFGRKVADAFDYTQPFFTHVSVPRTGGQTRLVSLPHPSGRNTVWNDARLIARAREILRELAPEIPWGSVPVEEAA
jgi:hypothetical protein